MAIYPGAVWRPLDKDFTLGVRITTHERVNLHTQWGNGSLFGYYNQPKQVDSHFWVSKKGLVEQYVDTEFMAQADLEGNGTTISIETEGYDEPWTDAQVRAIIALTTWCIEEHGIARKVAKDAHVGESSHGISWHRLGCDGNFPAAPSRYAGRLQLGGGRRYTKVAGKTCPTERRLDQILDVVAPAVLGEVPQTTPAPPAPKPSPAPAPAPKPAPRPVTDPGLRRGSRGAKVGRVQSWLRRSFPAYRWRVRVQRGRLIYVDNVYGAQSEAWVAEFQKRTGLRPDGWFGPLTEAMARRHGFTG